MGQIKGTVTYVHENGKETGPFQATYDDGDNYVDVIKAVTGYPTALDIKKFNKLITIRFKPNVTGKSRTWSTWRFFNNGQWIGDRFTELG